MAELNVYNGIPPLFDTCRDKSCKAAQALQKWSRKWKSATKNLRQLGSENITGYNDLVINKNLEDGENRPILPFIVVIVDELADLMMVASNEVEDAIIRLAQMHGQQVSI